MVPSSNIVFLIDVSGSMSSSDKLPLLQKSFNRMVDELTEKDTVSIVVYASSTGMVLEPTTCDNKDKIKAAINNLKAGGSTAGGAGIQLAYSLAEENFNSDGNNRVILATDGDFNVGTSDYLILDAHRGTTGGFTLANGCTGGSAPASSNLTSSQSITGNIIHGIGKKIGLLNK